MSDVSQEVLSFYCDPNTDPRNCATFSIQRLSIKKALVNPIDKVARIYDLISVKLFSVKLIKIL